MFGSTVLEIAIGLVFIYLVLSLVCSKINEYLASHLLSWRANTLEQAIIRMLGDPLKAELYNHPLINSLHSKDDKASYIPSHLFSLALLDIVDTKTGSNFVRGSGSNTTGLASVDTPKGKQDSDTSPPSLPLVEPPADQTAPLSNAGGQPGTPAAPADTTGGTADPANPSALPQSTPADPAGAIKSPVNPMATAANPITPAQAGLSEIDQRVNALTASLTRLQMAPDLTRALTVFVNDAEADAEKIRKNVEGWFNETMERASGVYKRKTQLIILVLAFVAAVLSNADTIMIVNRLSHQATLRVAATAAADQIVRQPQGAGLLLDSNQLNQLDMMVGWSNDPNDVRHFPGSRIHSEGQIGIDPIKFLQELPMKLIGLLITTFAVSLGAPFWFDVLGKIVNMRNAGRNPTEAPKTQSKTSPPNTPGG